jgi:flagellar basal-body rod protein FlgC
MPIKPIFSSLEISASGLTANRKWMDSIAENLANAQTTRTAEGGPYKRKEATFSEVVKQTRRPRRLPEHRLSLETTHSNHQIGMEVQQRLAAPQMQGVDTSIKVEAGEPRLVYDPDHPDANSEGYVAYPDVEVVKEMVDLITASRSYEANVTSMNANKIMNKKALEI